jgi:hypothetical protein
MLGGELVGRDTSQGVSEHHHGVATQPVDHRSGVSDELGPSKGSAVIGKAMAALIQRHHPSRFLQSVCDRGEDSAAAEAAVQR